MTLPDDGGRGTAFVSQLAAARAAVDADPLRGSPTVLMVVHMRDGNKSEALRDFERVRCRNSVVTLRRRAHIPG